MSTRTILALLAAGVAPLAAAESIKLAPATTYGTWDGWGTSLAWWAGAFGDRDDLADIFFTTKSTTLSGVQLPGLGFTIARYNAGACSYNEVNGAKINLTSNMIPTRAMQGFWLSPDSSDIQSASWNWTADANQRAMLAKAIERGVTHTELFSNSPMWWMLDNHNPAGADSGGDNLAPAYYDMHADYMAAVADKFAKDWNTVFSSVEPFNEPIATWWKGSTGTQEGCHFDTSTQAILVSALAEKMSARSLSSNTIISASDENQYDQALSTWKAIGSTAQAKISRINVHGYQQQNGDRVGLYNAAKDAGKALWNSEYGENDATGAKLVSNVILDLRWLHPTGWVYWQVLDGGGWGLIDADNNAKTVNGASTKYYALAQFSRHIRPGMTLLETGSGNAVAAYDASAKKLVVVAVNWGDPDNYSFNLSGFKTTPPAGTTVKTWETDLATDGNKYATNSNNKVGSGVFTATLGQNTVATYEIDGIEL